MIKPVCDNCMHELNEFGGLLFSPPDVNDRTIKWHLCVDCYSEIVKKFRNYYGGSK